MFVSFVENQASYFRYYKHNIPLKPVEAKESLKVAIRTKFSMV